MGKRWRNGSNERIRKSGSRINHDAACCCCCIADATDIEVTLDSITDDSGNNVCISTGCDSINSTYVVSVGKEFGPYCCLLGTLDISGTVSSNCGTDTERIYVQIVRGLDPADSRILIAQSMRYSIFNVYYLMIWKLTGMAADTAIQQLCDGDPVTVDFYDYSNDGTVGNFGISCADVSGGGVGACVAGNCTIQVA